LVKKKKTDSEQMSDFNPNRYDHMPYHRCGRSGLLLPALSLGLWHNFGEDASFANAQAMCRTAFDLGITHFDLAGASLLVGEITASVTYDVLVLGLLAGI